MANERTYLAWLRTSLTFASVGVALTQLLQLKFEKSGSSNNLESSSSGRRSLALGTVFIASGIVITAIGALRYFTVQTALTKDKFPVSRGLILIVFCLSLGLSAYVLAVLVGLRN